MNDLMRDLAPLCADAWTEIEAEAKRALTVTLAARKVADFKGPLGWSASAVDLGRAKALKSGPVEGVSASTRTVQPLIELCVPFTLKRDEMDAIARGADDANLEPVIEAARAIAMAEDKAVFHGFAEGGIEGIAEAAKGHAVTLPKDLKDFPGVLAKALSTLREAGVDGPYALVLGKALYQELMETPAAQGYPMLTYIKRMVDGAIVWAPGVEGGMLMSTRGGDFELTVGRDFSIGYTSHDAKTVTLYIQESLTFRCLAPEAAVPLK
jgi:uncharacterized linocin/CFP29 family protein